MKKKIVILQVCLGLVALYGLLSLFIQYEYELYDPDFALQDIMKSGFLMIGSILLLIYVKLFDRQ